MISLAITDCRVMKLLEFSCLSCCPPCSNVLSGKSHLPPLSLFQPSLIKASLKAITESSSHLQPAPRNSYFLEFFQMHSSLVTDLMPNQCLTSSAPPLAHTDIKHQASRVIESYWHPGSPQSIAKVSLCPGGSIDMKGVAERSPGLCEDFGSS